jgi:hypothetical protein
VLAGSPVQGRVRASVTFRAADDCPTLEEAARVAERRGRLRPEAARIEAAALGDGEATFGIPGAGSA